MMAGQWLVTVLVLGQALSGIYGANTDCVFGSNAAEGSPQTTRGQFIDLRHPLSCSGAIVAWHFCFYTENIASASGGNTEYQVYFRVYRNESENQLIRVHQVQTSLQMRPQDGRDISIICMDDELQQDQYLNVSQGDYLAAYIPSFSSPLMIMGTNTPGSLYRDTRLLFPLNFPFISLTVPVSSLEEVQDTAFHLFADVVNHGHNAIPTSTISTVESSVSHTLTGAMPNPTASSGTTKPAFSGTTKPATSMITLSQTPALLPNDGSLEVDSGSDSGLSSGGTAAIVIVILLIFALLVLIVLVVAIYLRRRLGLGDKKTYHGSVDSIDNAVYELPPFCKSSSFPTDYEVPMANSMKKVTSAGKSCPGEEHRHSVEELYASMNVEEVQDSGNVEMHYEQAVQDSGTVEMHYEQATAEVFNIYASTLRISSVDFTTQIKKFVSTLKRTTATPYCAPPSEEEKIYEQLSQHNLPHIPSDQIETIGHIGSGQFADVDKAWWMTGNGSTQVAVKTLHDDSAGRSKVRCLQEAALMAQFHHPNVVALHGIINENKISLVMEFLFKGDLRQHLLTMRPKKILLYSPEELVEANTAQRLLSYSHQVALGMLYLSDRGFVHRDLAARNVFVSDRDICKIGDFGMSRDLADAEYYVSEGGTIPIKWTAPEAVYYHKYSTASDVWSYGCLLYEIWGMGLKPFVDTPNAEVLNKLSTGYRLPPPPGCPQDVYKLMIECWNPFPNNRPGFQDVLVSLLEDEEQILAIPVGDASTHRQAACLGANMEAGYAMYLDLQEMYKSSDAPDFDDTIYESMAHVGPMKHGMVRIEEEKLELKNLQDEEDVYDDVDVKAPASQRTHDASEDEEIYACISDDLEHDEGSSNTQPCQNSTFSPPSSIPSRTIQPGNGILVHSVENAEYLITGAESKETNGPTQPEEESFESLYETMDY